MTITSFQFMANSSPQGFVGSRISAPAPYQFEHASASVTKSRGATAVDLGGGLLFPNNRAVFRQWAVALHFVAPSSTRPLSFSLAF